MEPARIAVALALVLGSACLAPQDIDEADSSAAPDNHAPRIVADQALVEGLPESRILVQTSCDAVSFQVPAVEDLDLDDELELRFFVDYDRGCDGCRTIRDATPILPSGDAIRTTTFVYVLQLKLDEGTHLVEAWVSDGFAEEATAQEPDADFREVLAGRGVDKIVWVVDVEESETVCHPVASRS